MELRLLEEGIWSLVKGTAPPRKSRAEQQVGVKEVVFPDTPTQGHLALF